MENNVSFLCEVLTNTLINNFDEVKTLEKNVVADLCENSLIESMECRYIPDSKIDYIKALDTISISFKTIRDKHYNDPLNIDQCYDTLFEQLLSRVL